MTTTKKLEETIRRWRRDPVNFVDEAILKSYNEAQNTQYVVTEQQKQGLMAVGQLVSAKQNGEEKDKLGVSIMAGKGLGKDAVAAWTILWFMTCFQFPKIPCVSVSADQLNKVLWSEISKWMQHSLVKDWFTLQQDKLFLKEAKGQRWFAFPKTANPKQSVEEQVETLAGIHEDFLLEVIDEGAGVLEPVFNVLEGNLTGKVNLMLLIFNPTRSKGYAIDTQQKNSDRWIAMRWSAEDSPLVDKEVIKRIEKDYGRDSNPFRIKVLGLPPKVDEETLIPWDWIEEAVDRERIPLDSDPVIFGIDCGGGGDKSVIATRKGYKVFDFHRNQSPDSMVLTNWIGNYIDAKSPDMVRIDTVGVGWAVEGMLREKKGAVIEAADMRRTADNPDRFTNKKAESYWTLREAFERALISIPNDPDLKDQLGATKYELSDRGKIKIMDKKKMKLELGHSPDEADALALTFYYPENLSSRVTKPLPKKQVALRGKYAWMEA